MQRTLESSRCVSMNRSRKHPFQQAGREKSLSRVCAIVTSRISAILAQNHQELNRRRMFASLLCERMLNPLLGQLIHNG